VGGDVSWRLGGKLVMRVLPGGGKLRASEKEGGKAWGKGKKIKPGE